MKINFNFYIFFFTIYEFQLLLIVEKALTAITIVIWLLIILILNKYCKKKIIDLGKFDFPCTTLSLSQSIMVAINTTEIVKKKNYISFDNATENTTAIDVSKVI